MPQDLAGVDQAPPAAAEEAARLPRAAIGYWTLTALFGTVPLGIAAGLARDFLDTETSAPRVLVELPWIVVVVGGVLAVAVLPTLRWRRWRYTVRDTDIDLSHGGVIRRRTIIPMNRVQHVVVEAGLLRQMCGVHELTINTAAGEITIPALAKGEADGLRRHIADLARLADG